VSSERSVVISPQNVEKPPPLAFPRSGRVRRYWSRKIATALERVPVKFVGIESLCRRSSIKHLSPVAVQGPAVPDRDRRRTGPGLTPRPSAIAPKKSLPASSQLGWSNRAWIAASNGFGASGSAIHAPMAAFHAGASRAPSTGDRSPTSSGRAPVRRQHALPRAMASTPEDHSPRTATERDRRPPFGRERPTCVVDIGEHHERILQCRLRGDSVPEIIHPASPNGPRKPA